MHARWSTMVPDFIRLSVGIEGIEDILADLANALQASHS
ncbi:MAG: PLP-dependent transferase [Fimbriimonas sp.]